MFTSFIMVTTMAVAVPAMMLIVMWPMVAVTMTSMAMMAVMAVMAVMKQCAKRYKSHCRTHNAVAMICASRCTG